MKKFVLLILGIICFAGSVRAGDPVYLLEKFTDGKIFFANGTFAAGKINYDLTTAKMQYILNDQLLEFPTDNNVTRVEFPGGRVFLQHGPNKFYEQIKRESGAVVEVNWFLREVNVGNVGAYGTTTQSAVTAVRLSTLPGGGTQVGDYDHPVYQKDVYHQKADNTYLFTKNGKEYKVKTLKNIYKAFPEQQAAIKAFVDEKKFSMQNAGNALQIIDYVLSL